MLNETLVFPPFSNTRLRNGIPAIGICHQGRAGILRQLVQAWCHLVVGIEDFLVGNFLAGMCSHTTQAGYEARLDAAPGGIEVGKLGRFTRILANALQAPVLDDVGAKALFVLDLHGVERAPVRVDADKELLRFGEGGEGFNVVCHGKLLVCGFR